LLTALTPLSIIMQSYRLPSLIKVLIENITYLHILLLRSRFPRRRIAKVMVNRIIHFTLVVFKGDVYIALHSAQSDESAQF